MILKFSHGKIKNLSRGNFYSLGGCFIYDIDAVIKNNYHIYKKYLIVVIVYRRSLREICRYKKDE